MTPIPHWINGRPVPGSPTLPVYNPWLGEVAGEVSVGDGAVVAAAVEGCLRAAPAWAQTPPVRRARILFRFRELLERHSPELAQRISQEHGKLVSDAQAALQRGLEVVEYACGIPNLLAGMYSENVARQVDSYALRQPVGICVGITPFNFPAMVPLWMIPIALACGNTFILKPSERDPSAAIRLAELWQQAGLPDGVLQVVQGDRTVVEGLLTHPQVAAISFVGSTSVAQMIYRVGTAHGKRVQALGGAKNPMVVMPDADLDQAVAALVGAAYGSAGERCMAITLGLAVGEVGDALVERLIPQVQQVKLGEDMGPLVTPQHRQRVADYIEQGVQEGAKLLVDGRQTLPPDAYPQGFWLGATLFDQVSESMRLYQEEIFGPVLGIVRVPDLNTALDLVNRHPYGNGAAIFTRDGGSARHFVTHVQAGMVGVNVPIPVPMPWHSFGGWKNSRFGDLGIYGEEGIRFYTRTKTVTSRWPEGGSQVRREFLMPNS
ncbi:MAG: CoA-acylating methylmalonate-semialdehyde dehydrogenase [Thermostichales cyanobacterium SZTDM-1c_bins_54]